MKRICLSLLIAFVAMTAVGLRASETSDNFAKWLPNMASADQNARKDAQQNWQNLCRSAGNNEALRKEVTQLAVDQLAKDNPVDTAVWLIRQLGVTGDDSVIPTLAGLLKSNEIRIRDEAARALANIPGKKAADALKAVDTPLAKDALSQHDQPRDFQAKYPHETVMPLAIPYTSAEEVAEEMKGYAKLDDLDKAAVLASLTVRRDGRYIKEALEALKSENETLRDAGILALETLGSSREIPVLLDQAFDGKNRDLAKMVLGRKIDRMLDAQLAGRLEKEQDAGRFETVADILNRRSSSVAKNIILKQAQAAECPNRYRLLEIAESLSSKDDVGEYVAAWELLTDRGQRDRAEQIIARLVAEDAGPVIAKRTEKNYAAMFSLLGRIGDEASLKEIRARVFKQPLEAGMTVSPEYAATALRAMFNWPDGRVADDLLKVAKSDDFNANEKLAALRAFIRVISLPNDKIRIKINDKEKVEKLAEAMKLATRVDEKRYVIERVGQVRTVESLTFIMQYFDDAELQDRVCRSVVDLAHHNELRRRDLDAFRAALDKVIEATTDNGLRDRARNYRKAD